MLTLFTKLRFLLTIVPLFCTVYAGDTLTTNDTSFIEKVTLGMYRNFKFLPEYHITADISKFFLQKNDFLKHRAFIENNTYIDLELIRYRKVSSVWQFYLHTGMGQSPGNVVFDPMDMNFAILPTFEWRPDHIILVAGLDHHCFHEIDRKDFNTVYWNKLILNAGSSNWRPAKYWSNLLTDSTWTFTNRFSWNVGASYYMRKFFGLVRETTINGENKNIVDINSEVRWAFYKRRGWIFNSRTVNLLGYYEDAPTQGTDSGIYWLFENSIEINFRKGNNGGMLFLTYTLDDMPKFQGIERFSKDQLLQIGIRFFM